MYKVVVHLLPQDATQAERDIVTYHAHAMRQTILQSVDDAIRLVASGLPTSTIVLWDAPRFPVGIVEHLKANGVKNIDMRQFANAFMLFNPLPIPLVVTSSFGVPRAYGKHEGVDLKAVAGGTGVVVRAGLGGTVNRVNVDVNDSAYGYYVVIRHVVGGVYWYSWYCHLAGPSSLRVGERVATGAIIGKAGNTGNSTGIHLHLNLQRIGAGNSGFIVPDVVDPMIYLQKGVIF